MLGGFARSPGSCQLLTVLRRSSLTRVSGCTKRAGGSRLRNSVGLRSLKGTIGGSLTVGGLSAQHRPLVDVSKIETPQCLVNKR